MVGRARCALRADRRPASAVARADSRPIRGSTRCSSTKAEVVEAAVAELEYQNRLLDSFGIDASHKIVVHVGSVERFELELRPAEQCTLALVLENDERAPLDEVRASPSGSAFRRASDVFHLSARAVPRRPLDP